MTPIHSRSHRSSPDNHDSSRLTESEPFLRDVELAELGGDTVRDGFSDDPSTMSSGGLNGGNPISPRHLEPERSWGMSRMLRRVCGQRFANRIGFTGRKAKSKEEQRKRSTLSMRILRFFAILFMIFGAIQCLGLILGLVTAFFPDEVDNLLDKWRSQGNEHNYDLSSTADVVPVRCHSHNDYWRTIPLTSAVTAGCTSVEADVWLHDDELYVGHSESSLKPNRTLNTLYIQPLLEMLTRQNPPMNLQASLDTPKNGIFDTDPQRTLVLLIDFKTNGDTLWDVVASQLGPLRTQQYLTHFNGTSLIQGPITVVVTGNAPFEKVLANTSYRDMFFDAPLDEMARLASNPPATTPFVYDSTKELAYLARIISAGSGDGTDSNQGQGHSGIMPSSPTIYSPFNSYYASTSIQASIGIPFPFLTSKQRFLVEDQIAGAHSLGLQVRYWEIPSWPVSWRNYLWRELVRTGIDYLNVDDLQAATKGSWKSQGGFERLIWGSSGW